LVDVLILFIFYFSFVGIDKLRVKMMSNGTPPARPDDAINTRWLFPQERAPSPPRDEGCKHNGFGDPALLPGNGSPPPSSPTITTLTLNIKEALNAALSLFQQKVTDITSDLTKDIQRMDNRLAQLAIIPHRSPSSTLTWMSSPTATGLPDKVADTTIRIEEVCARVLGACWGTEELGWNEGSLKKLRDVR